jgi:SDR family mycofactocin-dependent oxidoreductase
LHEVRVAHPTPSLKHFRRRYEDLTTQELNMGLLDGKVAFITGLARGQGRSHAVTLAREGCDIIGLDLCRKLESTPYEGSNPEDLAETHRLIEELGRRAIFTQADVRDYDAVKRAFDAGLEALGRVDIVIPNAGICAGGMTWEITEDAWREMLDINLTGPWHTVKAALPTMIEQGDGGAIVFIGSTESLKGQQNTSSYAAAKHGITGLMTSLALEVGRYNIRVNSINPGCVDTRMIHNPYVWGLFRPDLEQPTRESVEEAFADACVLPVPWIEPADVSRAILYLVAETGRYVTATTQVIDAGFLLKS